MYMQGTIEVGAFDAKTHFSELLRKIEKGIRVTVTKNGRPVATLTKATDDTTRACDACRRIEARAKRIASRGKPVTLKEIGKWKTDGRA